MTRRRRNENAKPRLSLLISVRMPRIRLPPARVSLSLATTTLLKRTCSTPKKMFSPLRNATNVMNFAALSSVAWMLTSIMVRKNIKT